MRFASLSIAAALALTAGFAWGQSTAMPAQPDPNSSANAAAAAGANTSATTGGFTVGEPVKDNTGVTIGAISALNTSANGAQMAVIKMGADIFQVQTDRLSSTDGAAMINLNQSQIASMLHGAASSSAPPAATGK